MDYCCYLLLNPRDPIDATRCKIFLDGDWEYNILREVQLIKIDRTVDSTFMLVESIKVTLMDCFFLVMRLIASHGFLIIKQYLQHALKKDVRKIPSGYLTNIAMEAS